MAGRQGPGQDNGTTKVKGTMTGQDDDGTGWRRDRTTMGWDNDGTG